MAKQILNKLIAVLIVLVLTMGNLVLIGTRSYAAYEELETQKKQSSDRNVEFDSYFYIGGNKVHSATLESLNESILNFEVSVANGFLNNIEINLDNPNFEIIGIDSQSQDNIVNSYEANKINLNQIDSNTTVIVSAKIKAKHGDTVDLNYLGRETVVNFIGNYTNIKGKESSINSSIVIRIDWSANNVQSTIDEKVNKVLNENGKIIVETLVTSSLNDGILPIKSSNININAPKIGEQLPDEVRVSSQSTRATNGKLNGNGFGKDNYSYNKDEGTLQININNEVNSDNKISWKSGNDELYVSYIYNNIAELSEIQLKGNNSITTYNDINVSNYYEKTEGLEIKGENINYGLLSTDNLIKGNIYANSFYETEYKSTIYAKSSYIDTIGSLEFNIGNDNYINESGEKTVSNTYYKNTKISKESFNRILGEDGNVKIFNGANLLAELTKDTEVDENGYMVFNYPEANVQNITIITSKPISEGIFIIENNKALTGNSAYTFDQLKTFKAIENNVNGITANTNLEETSTKADLELSNTNLSTVTTNENFEIRAILKSTDIKDDLYKNPTIEITLPEEVQGIEVVSANILYSEELQIANVEATNNVIRLALTGEQVSYIEKANGGITVIINANISVNKLATNREADCTMRFTNEKAVSIENDGIITKKMNIVAPSGVITLNSVTNTKTGEEATSFREEKEEVNLEMNTTKTVTTYTGTIINNENETINNLKIRGKLPKKGDDLGSTMDVKLAGEVKLKEDKQYTVYYSSDENADIANIKNKVAKLSSRSDVTRVAEEVEGTTGEWTTEPQEDSKTYLIEVNEPVEQGEALTVTYDAEVPENLTYNENALSNYTVTYNTMAQTPLLATSPVVTMATESGPVLEGVLTNNVDGEEIAINDGVKYTLNVKNTGTQTAENVIVEVDVPEGTKLLDNDVYAELEDKKVTFELGNMEVDAENSVTFYLKVKENIGEVAVKAIMKTDTNAANFESNEVKNSITDVGKVIYSFEVTSRESEYINSENDLDLVIENHSDEEIKNLEINIPLPDGIDYVKAYNAITKESDDEYLTITYESDKRNIKITSKESIKTSEEAGEAGVDFLRARIIVMPKVANKEFNIRADITAKNIETSKSLIISAKSFDGVVNVSSSSNIESGYIQYPEIRDVNYSIKLENTSDIDFENIKIKINLPDEFEYQQLKVNDKEYMLEQYLYMDDDTENEIDVSKIDYKNLEIPISLLEAGETRNIEIDTKIKTQNEITEDKSVVTKVSVDKFNYNKEYNYILLKEKDDENNNNDEDDNDYSDSTGTTTYAISGGAWIDSNKNGIMESSEGKTSGVTVKVVDVNSGNEIKSTTTDSNGRYILNNLQSGKYFVVFNYDTSKYSITTYKKSGVNETENSNAVESTYNNQKVGKTDTIEITNNNIANVNIGLVEGSTFDLSLNKKVTKISTATSKKTTSKNYNTQLAKIDLEYKTINNTRVVVEYTITVTNEGDIPGTATKIIDYLPKGFDFSTELNKDWYTSGDGIETKALANETINPGESKEVKLILTKSMTESGNGIYNNTSEIKEIYNELGKQDSDSTPGNRKSGEDDISEANVILGLRTGGTVTYITLTIIIMSVICLGAYEINKRVLKNK